MSKEGNVRYGEGGGRNEEKRGVEMKEERCIEGRGEDMGTFVFYILIKWAFSSVIARHSGPYFMFVSTKCTKTHIYSTNTL